MTDDCRAKRVMVWDILTVIRNGSTSARVIWVEDVQLRDFSC